MRKLLSLLTVSVPLNVIACGNKANPTPNPDSENPIDIVEILKKTQNKIASLFSDTFYINGKNNLKPTYFASEGDKLLQDINNANAGKLDDTLPLPFLQFIEKTIDTENFCSQLANNSELKVLFQGINVNDILKLKINSSKITKTTFDFSAKDGKFGIKNYNPVDYKVNSWNVLNCELSLTLKYKDENGSILDTDLSQIYNINFTNDAADILKVSQLASKSISDELQDYLANLPWNLKWNLNDFSNLFELNQEILNKIKTKIGSVVDLTKIKFNKTQLLSDSSKSNFFTRRKSGTPESLAQSSLLTSSKTLSKSKFLVDYDKVVNDFNNDLNNWNFKNLIPNGESDKVTLFGSYEINDWTFDGLILIPIQIPVILVDNMTRSDRLEVTAEKFSSIVSDQGILNSRITSSYTNTFTMKMNASDFENYKINNIFGDTVQYLSDKTSALATAKGIIDNNDLLMMKNYHTGTSGQNFNNQTLNTKLVDNNKFIHTQGRGAIDVWMYFNSFAYSFGYSSVNYIVNKGEDNKIWS